MTDNVIDYTAIRARLDASTEGPWIAEYSGEQGNCVIPHDAKSTREAVCVTRLYRQLADAEFIAHSRTDLEQLLDRVEALEGVYAAVQSVHYMIRVGEARPVRLKACAHCDTPWPCQTIRVIAANSALAAVPAAGEEGQ